MPLALLYLIPLLTFLALLTAWFRYGRDPRGSKNLPIRFAPPKNLTPAEAGVIVDERADDKDILASLIELAVRKHFVIDDQGGTLSFRLIQDYEDDPGLELHEKAIMRAIFAREREVTLAHVKEDFSRTAPFIKEELYHAVTKKGFFEKNPEKARSRFSGLGLILFGIALLLFVFGISFEGNGGMLGLGFESRFYHAFNAVALSSLLVFVFSQIMPKKTKKGLEVYRDLLGLEKFLKNPVDKPHGYAEEKVAFEKLLPYAVIFDAIEPWIEANATIYEGSGPSFWKSQTKLTPALLKERLDVLKEVLS